MSDLPAPAATVARAIAGAVARSLLKIAGAALVTRGLVDQGTLDGAIPTLAEEIAGSLLVAAASVWSVLRAAITHTRFANAWRALRDAAVVAADISALKDARMTSAQKFD